MGATRMMFYIALALAVKGLVIFDIHPASAQDNSMIKPDPKDVASIGAILKATYESISGAAGQARDWNRFRSLFIDGARLISVGPREDGGWGPRVRTPEQFIETANPYSIENGFFEQEIARKVDTFGHIAHAFSTYESRNMKDDPRPFARGINSFQLMHDGGRWWIVTIYWQGETEADPIPEKYLK